MPSVRPPSSIHATPPVPWVGWRVLRFLMGGAVGAVLGGTIYGLWALYANWDAGAALASRAALVHGLLSLFLTYTCTAVMLRVYRAIGEGYSLWVRGGVAFGGGMVFSYTVLFGIHALARTPHVLLTLAPGVLPNMVFCTVYCAALAKTVTSTS